MKNWYEHRPKEFEYKGRWIYNWFSNMIPNKITRQGIDYNSVENFYQAAKTGDYLEHVKIAISDPHKSKQLGKRVQLRLNWEEIKDDVMYEGLKLKFSQSPWKEKLLATNDEVLIEWNNWNDKIWGVSIVDNLGENRLGLLLMKLRDELRNPINN